MLRRAEPVGYEEFVAGRYREIVRFGVLLTGDGRLGEDLAQEGLIAAYRSWHRLGVPEGRPEAYVRQVMIRAAMRARRRRWRDEVPTGELPDASRGGFADQSDLSVQVLASLRRLPADQRVVLVLRFWADASEAEVAQTLGVAVGTVKSRTSRALAALRASGLFAESSKETP
ncbi:MULTISPECIES: SigE family RNA polymerase sigma factor [unclassified Micromonospora]|uniref:SigE family RNA polymerase sigma factor n=1 Tax=Micromonospora TaxID=1873 RepID=UPI00188DD194|nr:MULTISPECIES: SigE family RNA polymerase sigma factor [unclassified Micromonospora]MBF5030764.1 SigE family RNA polymerase sigma factor [Micromonospora sp. ANENR4]MCZ7474126.1 SigE family RNA polymerase sigma factor [Micromonospora sp. WMMC273]WBC04778.1 SigE family RNA polymerase sigma factor [Micromonospora sp. WMMA1976]